MQFIFRLILRLGRAEYFSNYDKRLNFAINANIVFLESGHGSVVLVLWKGRPN